MKNSISLMRECCLLAALLIAFPFAGKATTASKAFRARASLNKAQAITRHLTHSDTIPLTSRNAIYALSIDATIQQPREASFVRIVLEDAEGHNYLVAESDRFRNDTTTVQLSQYCEETALLGGITPACLKCYLAGDATLTLTGIHISDEEPMRLQSTSEESATAIKEAQVQDIVDRINEYNIRHGKLWQAGVTCCAKQSFDSQSYRNEEDAYLANMKYYIDGLYELGERTLTESTYQSQFVSSFDWRNRHGIDWSTSVKHQGLSNFCNVFAAVGVAEAITNLYYNDSTIDRDLSEKYICAYKYHNNEQNITLSGALEFLVTDSVIDEASLPFDSIFAWTNPRPYGQESIRLSGIKHLYKGNMSLDVFSDTLKYALIHNGPGVWGSRFFGNNNYNQHYMTLVGYGTTVLGSSYTIVTSDTSYTQTITSTMAGKTFWIFKNSFGDDEAHYINIVFNDDAYIYDACFVMTPVISRKLKNRAIKCEDRDGDGYFNWGISEEPPISLPLWAYREKDADDSNRNIGPMDEKGNPTTNNGADGWTYVNSYTIVNQDSINHKHIVIENGGTLVIKKRFHCFPGVCVYVESGGTLTIDAGILENIFLEIQPNATINIKNVGQLVLLKETGCDLFNLPKTASLNLLSGSIYPSSVVGFE